MKENKEGRTVNILNCHCKETLIIDTFHVTEEREAMHMHVLCFLCTHTKPNLLTTVREKFRGSECR